MTIRVSKLEIRFQFEREAETTSVRYRALDENGKATAISGQFPILGWEAGVDPYLKRCRRLMEALERVIDEEPVNVALRGKLVQVRPKLIRVRWRRNNITLISYLPTTGKEVSKRIQTEDLTTAQQRLLNSVLTSLDRIAWDDLRKQVGAASDHERPRVFISYRSGHEKFAEALAERLGKEGFLPWFDRWEIRAGDSVPGKIEQGFHESEAFIPVITADFEEGKWATDELMTAITKRVQEGYRIVPVLLEPCEKPELIKHLRHVDFSAQDPETYEAKVAELIDGIYAMELNPFR